MLQEFYSEIQQLWLGLRSWMYVYLLLAGFIFMFGLQEYTILERSFVYFSITAESFATYFFQMLVTDVVPSSIPLIVTSPLTAFVIQVKLSLFVAFVLTFPILLHNFLLYILPALYQRERSILSWTMVIGTVLFFSGVIFSYVLLVPMTLEVLYGFAGSLGVTTYLASETLLSFVFALLLVSGLAFTVPIVMVLLTGARLVPAVVWWQNWRQVLIVILLVSAIITPDGSGVAMLLLAAPTMVLYGCGAMVCSWFECGNQHVTI